MAILLRFLFLLHVLTISNKLDAQLEPTAANYKTWVISSGAKFRLPPPPNKTATQDEIKELIRLQSQRDEKTIQQIIYWSAGSPSYRWDQLARNLPSPNNHRNLALLHVAIYDATIAGWDSKYTFKRSRPSDVSKNVVAYIAKPSSPSYPCEHSIAAGAAVAILSYIHPLKSDSIKQLAQMAMASRLAAGVQYPSDVKAGFELGQRVAEEVILRAKKDGSDTQWSGKIPDKPGVWNGKNPKGTTWGSWKTWVLDSASQFRPLPPPDFKKDMEELKNYKPDQRALSRAYYYAFQDIWSNIVNEKIFEYNLQSNPPKAARVYALKSIAVYDAMLACWDAKYAYWGIRPYQYDTTFKQNIGAPPFPGYPSGHAAVSGAVSEVLSYLFPSDKDYFKTKAQECTESRFEGGFHFRTDNEVGFEMGEKIGKEVVKRALADGADQKRLINK